MIGLGCETNQVDAIRSSHKLDELLRISEGARMSLFDLDRLSDQEITRLENEFKRWRRDHGQGSGGDFRPNTDGAA